MGRGRLTVMTRTLRLAMWLAIVAGLAVAMAARLALVVFLRGRWT